MIRTAKAQTTVMDLARERGTVEDLTLDEVFKDVVRGQQQQQGASAHGVAP